MRYEYRFSTVEERRRSGAWWTREPVGYILLEDGPGR
jgi:hypothetical protein